MSIPVAYIKLSIGLALTSVALFTASASAQSPATTPDSVDQGISADDIEAVKAENAAVRELLRKMQEQQKTLLERVDRLPALTNQPALTSPTSTSELSASVSEALKKSGRYNEGIIIWQTADDVEVPFLLKINDTHPGQISQFLSADETFTDHLAMSSISNVAMTFARQPLDVHSRRLHLQQESGPYCLTVWTIRRIRLDRRRREHRLAIQQILHAHRRLHGCSGSRSLVNTFPYWTQMDRSMGDNFFRPPSPRACGRPGTADETELSGVPATASQYPEYLGTRRSIPHCLLPAVCGGNRWATAGYPAKSSTSDDYFAEKKVRIRIGTSYTIAGGPFYGSRSIQA
jgi:hypothetical protein